MCGVLQMFVLDEAGWRVLDVVVERMCRLLSRVLNRFQGVNWRRRLQVEWGGGRRGESRRARGHSMQL
jgi:hypothetical protein